MELSSASSEKIANLLATSGSLSQDRLTKITTQCGPNKSKIVEELLKKQFTTEADIAKIISRSYSIKQVDLKEDQIKPELINILPTEFVKKEKVIPFELQGGTLKVAIADPLKLSHGAKLKSYTKKNVLLKSQREKVYM